MISHAKSFILIGIIIVMFATAMSADESAGGIPRYTPTPMPTSGTIVVNVGQHKPVIVSGTYSPDYPKQHINDGNMNTIWGSLYKAGAQWFFIDMQQEEWVDYVNLCFFDPFYATEYFIATSDDAKTWDIVATMSNAQGGCITRDIKNHLRYIGVYLKKGPKQVFGIREFEVMTIIHSTPTPTPDEYTRVSNILKGVELEVFENPQPAPDFTTTSLTGTELTFSDLTQDVIFINEWTTWCHSCNTEAPTKNALWQTLQTYPGNNFTMICASFNEPADRVLDYMTANNYTYPAYLDPEGVIKTLYDIGGLPSTVIVYKKKIVGKYVGPRDWNEPAVVDALQAVIDLANKPEVTGE